MEMMARSFMNMTSALAALSALAHASRLTIFRALVQAGSAGLSAGKISDMLQIAPSSLSFHLKELAHAELVTATQRGRFVVYAANYSTMNALLAYLTENCCAGVPCVPEELAGNICDGRLTSLHTSVEPLIAEEQ
jgi:ArsR family transcriptional regulator, arsenate/arsenite/antimonite-responsive transcriptional repressor